MDLSLEVEKVEIWGVRESTHWAHGYSGELKSLLLWVLRTHNLTIAFDLMLQSIFLAMYWSDYITMPTNTDLTIHRRFSTQAHSRPPAACKHHRTKSSTGLVPPWYSCTRLQTGCVWPLIPRSCRTSTWPGNGYSRGTRFVWGVTEDRTVFFCFFGNTNEWI